MTAWGAFPIVAYTHGHGAAAVTTDRETLVHAFVNAHRAYEAHTSKAGGRAQSLFDQRQEALRVALEAGIPGTLLAAESDMSAGRVSQLRAKLGLSRPRPERVSQ